MNVIRQLITNGKHDTQTIRVMVQSNDRGPKGEKGDPGEAATITAGNAYAIEYGQTPAVINTGSGESAVFDFYIPKGQPGAIHYTAGAGVSISEDNVISVAGGRVAVWGAIDGDIGDQNDLMSILNSKQNALTAGDHITISGNTISATWPSIFTTSEWNNLWS